MRNILVLTDFSDSSEHAARYVAALSAQLSAFRIILYHSVQPVPVVVTEPIIPQPYNEGESLNEGTYRELTELKNDLLSLAYSGTVIDIHVGKGPFIEEVQSFIKEEGIDLIVMGTSGKGKIERSLMGSNTIAIIRSSHVSVLVVPPMASPEPLRTIAFASDLEEVREKTPVRRITSIAKMLNARLLVVNVSREKTEVNDDTIREQQDFLDIWSDAGVEYHYVVHNDPAEGIMEFAEENDVRLVIIIPKERSFFESFFHRSVSKQLAYHTKVPLLVLHSKE